MASKVRPTVKAGQNFASFGISYQVIDVVPYSDFVWKVTADQLDSGEHMIMYIPTDYRTTDGVWVGNL